MTFPIDSTLMSLPDVKKVLHFGRMEDLFIYLFIFWVNWFLIFFTDQSKELNQPGSVKIKYLSLGVRGKSLAPLVSHRGLVGPFQNSSFFTSRAMWCTVDLIYFSEWVG